MNSGKKLYQPRKLLDICAGILCGDDVPFHKKCSVNRCDRVVTTLNNDWSCSLRSGICMLCKEHLHHGIDTFYKCSDCDLFICGDCAHTELNLGSGQLRCDEKYIGILQTVYSIAGSVAKGTLLSVDDMASSSIYTFKCYINGLPNEEIFEEPIECHLIVEISPKYKYIIDIVLWGPHCHIPVSLINNYIIQKIKDAFMLPLSFYKNVCRSCSSYACRSTRCKYCSNMSYYIEGNDPNTDRRTCRKYLHNKHAFMKRLDDLRVYYYGNNYRKNYNPAY